METGNPKQVAVLAVAAVGALGFLFVRVGKRDAPFAPPAAPAARSAAPVPSVGPLVLLKDPFSHPRLAPVDMKPTLPEASPSKSVRDVKPLPSLSGALPPVGPLAVIETVPKAPKAAPKEAPKPVQTTIGLEAVASASDAVAFLTVGGGESQPFRSGQTVGGAIRLLRVEDGAVVLSGPKGSVTLDVGEKVTL